MGFIQGLFRDYRYYVSERNALERRKQTSPTYIGDELSDEIAYLNGMIDAYVEVFNKLGIVIRDNEIHLWRAGVK